MRYVKTRTVDDIGRLVIPKEIMREKGWGENTVLDVYYLDSKTVALRPDVSDYPVEDTCTIDDLNRVVLSDEILAAKGWGAKSKLDIFDVDDSTIALRLDTNDHPVENDEE